MSDHYTYRVTWCADDGEQPLRRISVPQLADGHSRSGAVGLRRLMGGYVASLSVPIREPRRTSGANRHPCGGCSPSEAAGDSKGRPYLLWKRAFRDPLPTPTPTSARAGCVQSRHRMRPSDTYCGRSPRLPCPCARLGLRWPGKSCDLYGSSSQHLGIAPSSCDRAGHHETKCSSGTIDRACHRSSKATSSPSYIV